MDDGEKCAFPACGRQALTCRPVSSVTPAKAGVQRFTGSRRL
ncbi:hypothetical protein [Methanoregula sp.]|nr:hypothetical protein [Methanoregula sp.]